MLLSCSRHNKADERPAWRLRHRASLGGNALIGAAAYTQSWSHLTAKESCLSAIEKGAQQPERGGSIEHHDQDNRLVSVRSRLNRFNSGASKEDI